MAKAQAEFTTGVMKNETVRQAAGIFILYEFVKGHKKNFF